MMSKEERDEARRRCEGATDGPWEVERVLSFFSVVGSDVEVCAVWSVADAGPQGEIDADFIAHARHDLPQALDALDAKDVEIADHKARSERMLEERNRIAEKLMWSKQKNLAETLVRSENINDWLQGRIDAKDAEIERLTTERNAYHEALETIASDAIPGSLDRKQCARDYLNNPAPVQSEGIPPAVRIIARCVPITGAYERDGTRCVQIALDAGDDVRLRFDGESLRFDDVTRPQDLGEERGWYVHKNSRPGQPVRCTFIGDCVLTHECNFRPATAEELKEWFNIDEEDSQ